MTEKDKELNEEELEEAIGGLSEPTPADEPAKTVDYDPGGQDMQRRIRRHTPPTGFEGFTVEQ